MTTTALAIYVHDGEPRVLDTDLAARLGLPRAASIRTNIMGRHRPELETYGPLHQFDANSGKPGRPSIGFYLNEDQACLVAMFSRASGRPSKPCCWPSKSRWRRPRSAWWNPGAPSRRSPATAVQTRFIPTSATMWG